MKKFQIYLGFKFLIICAFLMYVAPAYADPINIFPSLAINSGNEVAQSWIENYIITEYETTLLYKDNVDTGPDNGLPLSGSYQTEYDQFRGSDPTGATISYVGGDIVGPTAYLLVKDGKQTPAWYLFDLTNLSWAGFDDLVLRGFWPTQGAISNVALFGEEVPVPEPATVLLLGFGLFGLILVSRKKNQDIA